VSVKTAVVVFLTDGCDNKYHGQKAIELVSYFKEYTKEWTKQLIVHTVGFSSHHDFHFLDKLRKCGTSEGVFRYADPKDSGDTLCTKLSDLASSIFTSSSLNVRVKAPVPLLGGSPASSKTDHAGGEEERETFEIDVGVPIEEDHGQVSFYVDLSEDLNDGLFFLFLFL